MEHVPVTLEAAGVKSYAELFALPLDDVMDRLDTARDTLHPGDAFLAVIVLRAVVELRDSAVRLDNARVRWERFMIALAVIATAATVGQLVTLL